MDLAEAVRDMGYMPEQVQDLPHRPAASDTVCYAAWMRTHAVICVARRAREGRTALIRYRKPENWRVARGAGKSRAS